jgi:hypothetical protein
MSASAVQSRCPHAIYSLGAPPLFTRRCSTASRQDLDKLGQPPSPRCLTLLPLADAVVPARSALARLSYQVLGRIQGTHVLLLPHSAKAAGFYLLEAHKRTMR